MVSALIQSEGYDTYVGDELDAVARYPQAPSWATFGVGWENRVKAVQAEALSLSVMLVISPQPS